MKKESIEIKNKLGLHARAAAKLSHLANSFKAEIFLIYNDSKVNAKSLLGILTLGAGVGNKILVEFEGMDEEDAARAIIELFERKFDEEK